MSEGAPVKRDKACFPACLQVINSLSTMKLETRPGDGNMV